MKPITDFLTERTLSLKSGTKRRKKSKPKSNLNLDLDFTKQNNSLLKDVVFEHRGKKIIDTKHSVERRDMRNTLADSELKIFYKNMINYFVDNKIKVSSSKRRGDEYIVFSKSLKQGAIVAYRVPNDIISGEDQPQIVLITFLPRNKSFKTNSDDIEAIVESKENREYAIIEVE